MSMHVSMKHSLHKKHHCPLCTEKFAAKTQLQHHFVNNHCDPDIPCGFPGCTLLFKNTTTQRMHYVRSHMKDQVMYSSSSMKGYKICLTCNIFLKRANMMYHLAHCSPDSPFCTNTAALEKKRAVVVVAVVTEEDKDDEMISMLAELGDLDEDFFQVIKEKEQEQEQEEQEEEEEEEQEEEEQEEQEEEEEEESLDDIIGRVLTN